MEKKCARPFIYAPFHHDLQGPLLKYGIFPIFLELQGEFGLGNQWNSSVAPFYAASEMPFCSQNSSADELYRDLRDEK